MKYIKLTPCLFFVIVVMTSCSMDDITPQQVNETEVISDVTLIFTDSEGMQKSYTYTDPKYRTEDYQDPIIRLSRNRSYDVTVKFYDKSNPDDIEDVTEEIEEEKDDHFVEYRFYKASVDLTRTDNTESTDENGIQIGLFTNWKTGNSAEGSTTITLIHKPEIKKTANPDGNHIGGETDAEVIFDLVIE